MSTNENKLSTPQVWLDKFPPYTKQLWLDSNTVEPTPSVDPSQPAEGEFRFLLIPQDEVGNFDEVPMLVLILEDLQDGYFKVMLTHCERAMQTYSDLYVTSEETGLGYGVFLSTAIVNPANVHCLSKTAVGKLIPSIIESGYTYNFGPSTLEVCPRTTHWYETLTGRCIDSHQVKEKGVLRGPLFFMTSGKATSL